jgi:hypothetical protein
MDTPHEDWTGACIQKGVAQRWEVSRSDNPEWRRDAGPSPQTGWQQGGWPLGRWLVLSPKDLSAGARLYAETVIVAGVMIVLRFALLNWTASNPILFAALLALCSAAAALKARVSGIDGTLSGASLFLVLAISEAALSETVVTAMAAGGVQTLWRPKHPPTVLQLLFNMAAIVVSTAAAYAAAHGLFGATTLRNMAFVVMLAAFVLATANTLLVSGSLALAHGRTLVSVWRDWRIASIHYYAMTTAAAAAAIFCAHMYNWLVALMVLPLAYLAHRRLCARISSIRRDSGTQTRGVLLR